MLLLLGSCSNPGAGAVFTPPPPPPPGADTQLGLLGPGGGDSLPPAAPLAFAFGCLALAAWVLGRRARLGRALTAIACSLLCLLGGAFTLAAHVLKTSAGTDVSHFHPGEGLNAAAKQLRKDAAGLVPGTRTDDGDPTTTYNCHGRTFDGAGSWVPDPTDLVKDDTNPVLPGQTKVGDILVYKKGGTITHTATVTKVDGTGNATEVRSKWGDMGQYLHKPDEVPKGQSGMVGGKMITLADYGSFEVRRKK